jgi:TRAP-type C4-dicarboxylate transport system permease small subunit
MRQAGPSLPGAYDIVKVLSAVMIACCLPYTTAVKGHVAVEFFFHMLSHRKRIAVDTVVRIVGIALFGCLAWYSCVYGAMLYRSGVVTDTLQIPLFWLPYILAFSCGVVTLIKVYNMLHPGRLLIEP